VLALDGVPTPDELLGGGDLGPNPSGEATIMVARVVAYEEYRRAMEDPENRRVSQHTMKRGMIMDKTLQRKSTGWVPVQLCHQFHKGLCCRYGRFCPKRHDEQPGKLVSASSTPVPAPVLTLPLPAT
ncbi:unnamed protein product, partial [Discosporangium mesarthrocarpum]